MSTTTPWTRHDPFLDVVDSFFRGGSVPAARTAAVPFTPAVETRRDGDDVLVRVELPGIDADRDVTVEVRDGSLVVRGERRDESGGDGVRRLREVRYGSFARRFTLPSGTTAEQVSAWYDAGVLTVRVAGVHAAPAVTRIPVAAVSPAAAAEPAGATDQTGGADVPAAEQAADQADEAPAA